MNKLKNIFFKGEGKFRLLLLLQFALLIFTNLAYIDKNLDCDNCKLMTHIIKMWEHRTLVIPDWSYSTTLEWDCTSIFAIPFYAVTKNIYLSCGLSNIILSAIFLLAVYYLLKDKTKFYLAANFLLIPYSTGMLDYFNMMFFAGTQYIVKVTVPLLFVGIIVFFEEKKKMKALDIVILCLYTLLLFDTAMSSGIYVLAAGIGAVVAGYVVYKLRRYEKIQVKNVVFVAISLVIYFTGMVINQKVLGGTRGESMTLCPVYEIGANARANFWGLFELAGGLTKKWYLSVFTVDGILTVIKFTFVVVLLVVAALYVKKILDGKLDLLTTMLVLLFYWNLLIMMVVKTQAGSATSEYRYYLIGFVPLVIVMATHFYGVWQMDINIPRQKFNSFLVFTGLAVVSLGSYFVFITKEDTALELKQVAEYCENAQYDVVYLFDASNDSDILRVLDRDREYLCLLDTGQTYVFDYYSRYVLGGVQKDNAVLLVDNTQHDYPDEFTIVDMNFKKKDTVGNRTVYVFQ